MFATPNTPVEHYVEAHLTAPVKLLPKGHFKGVRGRASFYLNDSVGKGIEEEFGEDAFDIKIILGEDSGQSDPRAAGWIKKLSWRADGLHITDFSLSKRAREVITNDEYRYFVPVFYCEGNVPKKVLGVLLSNDPELRQCSGNNLLDPL